MQDRVHGGAPRSTRHSFSVQVDAKVTDDCLSPPTGDELEEPVRPGPTQRVIERTPQSGAAPAYK